MTEPDKASNQDDREVAALRALGQVYIRAFSDARKDALKTPFASVGGLDKRSSMIAPPWAKGGEEAYLEGYRRIAADIYGPDWQTAPVEVPNLESLASLFGGFRMPAEEEQILAEMERERAPRLEHRKSYCLEAAERLRGNSVETIHEKAYETVARAWDDGYSYAESIGRVGTTDDRNVSYAEGRKDADNRHEAALRGTFAWALLELKLGTTVQREPWGKPGPFLYLTKWPHELSGMTRPFIAFRNNAEESPWTPSHADLLSTDWQIA